MSMLFSLNWGINR